MKMNPVTMKMERVAVASCLLFAFAILMQGCDFGASQEAPTTNNPLGGPPPTPGLGPPPPALRSQGPSAVSPQPVFRKASAKCRGGHFDCEGGWSEWCSRMKRRCSRKHCAPMCEWTCDSPKCNQECGPVCNEPVCSTRCKGFNTDSCKMKCGEPSCRVVCPKHFCPTEDCAACKTECGKPSCFMECGRDEQPCKYVCAQPVCRWECKNPSLCPQPKCSMKCKKPACSYARSSAHAHAVTHMFSNVPPLEPGETEIVTSHGPSPAPAPAPPPTTCKAEGGKTCYFPFLYNGHTYTGCSNAAYDGSKESYYWCPTQVTHGTYVIGSGTWAKCQPQCPKISVLQRQSTRMQVNFTRMMDDGTLDKGQVDLALVQEAATDVSDSMENSWAAMVSEANGQVTESEASCTRGKFYCQGDVSWCAEQKTLGCKGGQTAFLRQRSQSQGHLQA